MRSINVVFVSLLAVYNATVLQAILVSSLEVACTGDAVTFTCTVAGAILQWEVNPPASSGFTLIDDTVSSSTSINVPQVLGSNPGFQFQRLRTAAQEGLKSTLATISNISSLNGTMVTCQTQGTVTIQVADPPSLPRNPMLEFDNRTNTSVVTLQWAPPTSTGGVDISYVLTVSPPPVSGSTVTTQTSTDITVSYNIQYSVNIRATNCAGSSQDTTVMFELVACSSSPSTADGVVLNNVPSVTTEGSTLTFTCMGTSNMVTSTCGSVGRWSPDPADYICMTTTAPTTSPIFCGLPRSPLDGSLGRHSLTSPLDTTVTFQCDDGLFPNDTMTATCRNLSGRGEWEPNPADLVCRIEPAICILPDLPVNGVIVNYCNINTVEGSVIAFRCNPGFLPEGEMTATCTNAGIWSPDPAGVDCSYNIKTPVSNSLSIGEAVGVSIVLSSIVSSIIGLFVGVMFTCCVMRKQRDKGKEGQTSPIQQQTTPSQHQTPAAGPVYEEVSLPKEEIELKTNQAYGPVGSSIRQFECMVSFLFCSTQCLGITSYALLTCVAI